MLTQSQIAYQDYLCLMLGDDGDSDRVSDDGFDDQELYELKNNYLENLNIVRKRLNLLEISDYRYHQTGCTITEVTEEEYKNEDTNIDEENVENIQEIYPSQDQSNGASDLEDNPCSTESENVEITTIHPFSLCYKTDSKSLTNIFELEYDPPKKKSCFRLKTPKLPSVSESNIPYHTKVSLHEDVFKPSSKQKRDPKNLEQLPKISKEIQCNSREISNSNIDEVISTSNKVMTTKSTQYSATTVAQGRRNKSSSEGNILPNAVMENRHEESMTSISCSENVEQYLINKRRSRCRQRYSYDSFNNTEPTSSTNKDSPRRFKRLKRKKFTNKVSPIETLFDEVTRLQCEQARGDIEPDKNDPYISNEKNRRIKSSPFGYKRKVPHGPVIVKDIEKGQNLETIFYNLTSSSEEEKTFKDFAVQFDSIEERRPSIWTRLLSCILPCANLFPNDR